MTSSPFLVGRDRCDSGYASADNSESSLRDVVFTKPHLKYINSQLDHLTPQEILQWCLWSLPGLYQETSFGLSGLVTIDMLSKMSGSIAPKVDLIFLDTLHHFQETLNLVERVQERYGSTVHVFKPAGVETSEEFAAKHGDKLWEVNEELYDWTAKVEPSERAYLELGVKAVLTGRRRAQGDKRENIPIVEIDDTGLIKVNPLANWSFQQVNDYVKANSVPYNLLLDQGYKSIGDWHSTQPVSEDEGERAGRWKGTEKTECGIHNPKSRYFQFLQEQKRKEEEAKLEEAFKNLERQEISVA